MVSEIFLDALRSLLRAVLFLAGMLFGYLFAIGVASYPGGNPAVAYLMFFTFLTLGLAAPVCWFFAEVRHGVTGGRSAMWAPGPSGSPWAPSPSGCSERGA